MNNQRNHYHLIQDDGRTGICKYCGHHQNHLNYRDVSDIIDKKYKERPDIYSLAIHRARVEMGRQIVATLDMRLE